MMTLIRNIAILAGADLLVMVVTVGQTRFLAESIGPAGFGIYGLLLVFFRIFSSMGSVWMTQSSTRWISHHLGNGNSIFANQVFTAALVTSTVVAFASAVILIPGSSFFINHFLSEDITKLYFLLLLLVTILTSYRTVLQGILQGLLRFGWISTIRVTSAIVQVLLVIGLTWMLGLPGFFLGLAGGALAAVGLSAFAALRAGMRFTRTSTRDQAIRSFAAFGAVDLGLLGIFSLAEFAQRAIVLDALGIDAVGLMFAAIAIINNMEIINRAIITYLFPKMSQGTTDQVREGFILHLRFALYSTVPLAIGLTLFSREVVAILLGDSFQELTPHLYTFVLWFFLSSIHNPVSNALLSMAKLRIHAYATITSIVVTIGLLVSLLEVIGFSAVGIALVGGQVAAYIIRSTYYSRIFGFNLGPRLWTLHLLGIVGFIVASFAQDANLSAKVLLLVLIGLALYFSLDSEEKVRIKVLLGQFRR